MMQRLMRGHLERMLILESRMCINMTLREQKFITWLIDTAGILCIQDYVWSMEIRTLMHRLKLPAKRVS